MNMKFFTVFSKFRAGNLSIIQVSTTLRILKKSKTSVLKFWKESIVKPKRKAIKKSIKSKCSVSSNLHLAHTLTLLRASRVSPNLRKAPPEIDASIPHYCMASIQFVAY